MLLTTLSECEEPHQACAFPRYLCAIGFLANIASYLLEHLFNGLIGLLHGANQMLGKGAIAFTTTTVGCYLTRFYNPNSFLTKITIKKRNNRRPKRRW